MQFVKVLREGSRCSGFPYYDSWKMANRMFGGLSSKECKNKVQKAGIKWITDYSYPHNKMFDVLRTYGESIKMLVLSTILLNIVNLEHGSIRNNRVICLYSPRYSHI